jgi:hypothetical protein
VRGISTRPADELVKAIGMSGIFKSQVSRLREEIDGWAKHSSNGRSRRLAVSVDRGDLCKSAPKWAHCLCRRTATSFRALLSCSQTPIDRAEE